MQNVLRDRFDLTTRTICGLLGQALFGVPYTPEDGVDWNAVFRESRQQAVCVQVFAASDRISALPAELRGKIQAFLFQSFSKNARIHAQHTKLHRQLSALNVPYTILKGAASAAYYADPLSRAMGDVDFYVAEANFEQMIEWFRAQEYEVSHLDHDCHVVLKKDRLHMEMHRVPAGVPHGEVGERILSYLSDLDVAARLLENGAVSCLCPSPFHHGLVMLMHLQHHILAEGVGLRHLCDWAVFVNSFEGNAFAELFEARLKSVGLWRLAQLLSLASVQFLGMPEQPWIRSQPQDEEIAADLMQDFLSGGNFGRKDRQRAYEGMFISQRGKDGLHHNRLLEAFGALHRITCQKHPFFDRCKIFLPIGWVITFVGYLLRNKKRRKNGVNISTLDAYRQSESRQKLYQQLKLYEPEA